MAFSAFGTFLLRQFMITLPRSYDEAAESLALAEHHVLTGMNRLLHQPLRALRLRRQKPRRKPRGRMGSAAVGRRAASVVHGK